MLDNRYDLSPILATYPAGSHGTRQTDFIRTGGFSGSQIWQLLIQGEALCLRRWPAEFSDSARLEWIHDVLEGVCQTGFQHVPVPFQTSSGDVFVNHDGYLWQLEPWLPGAPVKADGCSQRATPVQVSAALTSLAEFHTAVLGNPAHRLPEAYAPGMVKRLSQLNELQSSGLERLSAAVVNQRQLWPELAERAASLLAAFNLAAPRTGELLQQVAQYRLPVQPCIRDIHRDHVLFEGNRVTGIIDFGAMQPDNSAGDIARLLGSLAGDDLALWELGLQAFEQVQPLSEIQRRLVKAYDEGGVLLSGINWLRWVFIDLRQFENRAGVLARFDEIFARLLRLGQQPSPKECVIV